MRLEDRPLFDWPMLRNQAQFVLRSIQRHRLLGAGAFALCLSLAIGAAVFLPRRYQASVTLLSQPTSVMAALTSPYGGMGTDDAPTLAARERVLSRESMQKIVAQTGLVEHWKRTRNPVLRVKDAVLQLLTGAWTEDLWSEIIVGTLEQRLLVSANDGVVEISVTWPDALMARRIVEAAQQGFVESRHVGEQAAMNEAVGILEQHAAQTEDHIEEALENLRQVVAERARGDAKSRELAYSRSGPRKARKTGKASPQEVAQLKFMLQSKQRAIANLEERKRQQVADLQAALDQQYVVFNRSSPAISELERKVSLAKRDAPQLQALKHDEAELKQLIEDKGGKVPDGKDAVASKNTDITGMVNDATLVSLPAELERDPAITVAQEQLRVQLSRYQDLLMRIEAARIAVDTARAAFKYRFYAIKPAQTPKVPLSPNVLVLLLAGMLAGVAFAFAATASLDVWRRTLVENWQIEKQLGLAVLVHVGKKQ